MANHLNISLFQTTKNADYCLPPYMEDDSDDYDLAGTNFQNKHNVSNDFVPPSAKVASQVYFH